MKNISSSKSSTVDLSVVSKSKPVTKIVGIIFMGLSFAVTVMPAAMAETFSIDGMALNTNNNFPRKDGQPIMSTWKLNPNDNDQQFDRQGNSFRHRSTGKCLNAYQPSVGSAVNIWPCNNNDGDQQFLIHSVGGNANLIQRKGTNLCLDMDSRNANTRMKLWDCSAYFGNQRFVINANVDAPPQIVPKPPLGGQVTLLQLPTSTTQANQYFKLQYSNSTYNPDGPLSSLNCGPSSVAMIVKLFGKEPPNLSVQTSINRARQLMNAPGNTLISDRQMMTGLVNAGLKVNSYQFNGNLAQIDRDLSEGKAVIAMGYYGNNWRNQFPSYSLTGNGNINHINTILGKTPNGNYLVGDPMYRGGVVEMNRNQLMVFFSYNGGLHISVSK